ncbi:MAG: ATP-binding protein [Nitrospirota bacterium]
MSLVDSFDLQNPWRDGRSFKVEGFIKRNIMDDIAQWMDDEDVLVLLGPRQSGKTTIIKKLIEDLAGSINTEAIFYFNLDDETLIKLFRNPGEFIKFIRAYLPEGKAFVFIDEVQRVREAGLFLKYIYDAGLNIKLIVSGSSSLEITAKVKEYLTGRKKVFRIYPLSFNEIVRHKRQVPAQLLSNRTSTEEIIKYHGLFGEHLLSELMDYMSYGGYPKVYLRQEHKKKETELSEIFSSYVKKDVTDYLRIEQVDVFNRLVSLLAFQTGNLVNKQELSATLQTAWVTIEKYLRILEETFVIKLLPPYYTNKRKEITKMHKVYFMDTGLRNFIVRNFMPFDVRADKGALFENVFFTERIKHIKDPSSTCFWRTQAGAEVDYILIEGEKIIPVEIKATRLKAPKLTKSFKNFIDAHKPENALIATLDFCGEMTYSGTHVKFIPLPLVVFNSEALPDLLSY